MLQYHGYRLRIILFDLVFVATFSVSVPIVWWECLLWEICSEVYPTVQQKCPTYGCGGASCHSVNLKWVRQLAPSTADVSDGLTINWQVLTGPTIPSTFAIEPQSLSFAGSVYLPSRADSGEQWGSNLGKCTEKRGTPQENIQSMMSHLV